MELSSVLEQIGLKQKQAAVYLATLELGQVPVGQIAYKASVKRTTTYVILDELQEKGLIEVIPGGSTTRYQAVDPAVLMDQLTTQTALFKENLPEFRALLNASPTKPKVRFYEGKKGIYSLYNTEILQQKEIFSLVNIHDFAQSYSEKEMRLLLDRMKTSGVIARELVDDSPAGHWYIEEKNNRQLGKTKLLPKKFKFDVDFIVYANTVATISLKNLVAVVVEDSAISQAQLQLLEFLWKSLKSK